MGKQDAENIISAKERTLSKSCDVNIRIKASHKVLKTTAVDMMKTILSIALMPLLVEGHLKFGVTK